MSPRAIGAEQYPPMVGTMTDLSRAACVRDVVAWRMVPLLLALLDNACQLA